MSKTKADLITETLQELGVLAAGQSASSEDTAAVDARIVPLLQDLAIRNVIYIGDANAIPDEAFNHLVMRLAEACARKFGRDPSGDTINFAESNLRTLARIGKGKGGALKVDHALQRRRPLGSYGW